MTIEAILQKLGYNEDPITIMRTFLVNFRKSPPTPPKIPKDKEDIVVENVPTKDDNIEPQVGHIKNPEITEGRKALAIK